MLKFKKEAITEALNRYTKINYRQFEIKPTVESDKIFGYRNRSQLAVRKDMNFKYTTTMLKEKSNQAININECMVQDPNINRINNEILKLADELEIPPYVAKYNRGGLRYLVTRVNQKGEALVCIICAEKNSKVKELAKRAINITGVKSVYESFNNSKKENTFFGDEINHLEGDAYIIETIGKIKYRIYPNTFFQLNTAQAKKMYDLVLKACKLSRKERVLDAYCGVGTIGLYLAHMAKEVVGIEYNKDAVIAANENAKINKIKNSTFLQGDAKELLPKMLKEGQEFDILVVDPPRVGLGEEFINTIIEAKIPRLVYASCNPATLAKDLEVLSKIYQIKYITPLDMFPQTAHVETVVLLSRKDVYERIKFDVNVEDLQGRASSTATYSEIKAYILEKYGLKVSSLYIAQIKDKCGFEKRDNYNIGEGKSKELICPPEKEQAIMDAFRHFGMLRD